MYVVRIECLLTYQPHRDIPSFQTRYYKILSILIGICNFERNQFTIIEYSYICYTLPIQRFLYWWSKKQLHLNLSVLIMLIYNFYLLYLIFYPSFLNCIVFSLVQFFSTNLPFSLNYSSNAPCQVIYSIID